MNRWLLGTGLGVAWAAGATAADTEVEWRSVGSPRRSAIVQTATQEPRPPIAAVAPISDSPIESFWTNDKPVAAAPIESLPIMPKVLTDAAGPPRPAPAASGIAYPAPPCHEPACGGAVEPTWIVPTNAAGNSRGSIRAEYLAWWTKSASTPALLTTSRTPFASSINPRNGNTVINIDATAQLGSFAAADTVTLLGGDDLDRQFRSGVRVGASWMFDSCGSSGVDANFFYTERATRRFDADTFRFRDLYRPFTGIGGGFGTTPTPTTELVGATSPGIVGSFSAVSRSRFWGADIAYRGCLARSCTSSVDWFAGFRYLNLDEDLELQEHIVYRNTVEFQTAGGRVLQTNPAGTRIDVFDRFGTGNDFYGAQVGVNAEFRRDRWSLGVRPAISIGSTVQSVNVAGNLRQSVNGNQQVQDFVGGLFALRSNIGNRSRSEFTYVPEITLKLGYDVTSNIRLTAGYDFLYWSRVVRPGDQIDTTLDLAQVPPNQGTATRPLPLFQSTDFWAQGLSAGLEYRW